jgi:S1-C subfamily serine protease
MPSGLVIHIVSGDDRHTEVLSTERIRIGVGEDCDLRLRASALPPELDADVVLELGRGANNYRVKGFDTRLGLTQNGQPIELNARIKDGDEIRLDGSELELQFFPIRALPAVVNQREALASTFADPDALEPADRPKRDDAKVFLRELTSELIREINPSTKIITLLILGVLVGGVLYLGFSIYREMRTLRRTSDSQQAEAGKIRAALEEANRRIEIERQRSADLQKLQNLSVKVFSEFGRGVGVVSGTYIFVESATGRPLRYPTTQMSDGAVIQDGESPPQLTPDGDGSIAEFEFAGTGFYVGNGFVITNRHVVQPWQKDLSAQSLSASVNGKPKLKNLVIYFPGMEKPLPITVKQTSSAQDLAACVFDNPEGPINLPTLPFDDSEGAVTVGKEVVGMGYPNGPERLLATLPEEEAAGIQARYGRSLVSLLAYLASVNKVTPQTTKGIITDLNPARIVHSAATFEGGSGAPLFGDSGRVIGVNFAVYPENTASNMAIPAKAVLTLLGRAGWTPPVQEPASAAPAATQPGTPTH